MNPFFADFLDEYFPDENSNVATQMAPSDSDVDGEPGYGSPFDDPLHSGNATTMMAPSDSDEAESPRIIGG